MDKSWASGHGMGRYPGSLSSTQPVGVSSPAKDSFLPAFVKQDEQQHQMFGIPYATIAL